MNVTEVTEVTFRGPHAETALVLGGGTTIIPLTPEEIELLDELFFAIGTRKGVI